MVSATIMSDFSESRSAEKRYELSIHKVCVRRIFDGTINFAKSTK